MKKQLLSACWAVLGLLACLNGYTQSFLPPLDRLGIDEGLSQSTVNTMLRDRRGFMWFGTNDGLNRFDGYAFHIYRKQENNPHSISDNKVYELAEDAQGTLWVGTRNGLNAYSYQQNHFQRYAPKGAAEGPVLVRSIHVGANGTVWAGTFRHGLFLLPAGADSLQPYPWPMNTVFEQIHSVWDILQDRNGTIWLATNLNGLVSITDNKPAFHPFEQGQPTVANYMIGKTLYQDSQGRIWMATEGNGLFWMWPKEGEFRRLALADAESSLPNRLIVKDILEINHTFWIATDGDGLIVVDEAANRISHWRMDNEPKGLVSNAVYDLYRDAEGITWIGTFTDGVQYWNPWKKHFRHFTHTYQAGSLSHKAVLSFVEDAQGTIWVGTDGGGLNRFDAATGQFTAYKHDPQDANSLSSNAVTALMPATDGRVWVGTYAGGLLRFTPETGVFERIPMQLPNGQKVNPNIWCLAQDADGHLWVGTLGGLYHWDTDRRAFSPFRIPNPQGRKEMSRILSLLRDRHNRLWIGGEQLACYEPATGKYRVFEQASGQAGSLGRGDIRCILEDSHGRIWVTTEGSGLYLFEEKKSTFRAITQQDGLPSDVVHQVREDAKGRLWVSTNHGLARLTPQADGWSIRAYDWHDGLQSNQFSYGAAYITRDCKMLFGGVNGFNWFDPDSIRDNPNLPPVVLSSLKINEKEVMPNDQDGILAQFIDQVASIELNYEQSRVFSIEFAALNFTSPVKNQYAYRLLGFNDEWSYVSDQRKATYTNLNPGTYTFQVKASNNDGIWNETGRTLQVIVRPPWWKTGWAYAGYMTVFLLLLLLFRHFALERIRLENNLKIKELEQEKIKEVNQMKLAFFTNISHEFRTPLTLILGPLERLIENGGKHPQTVAHLQLIHRNAKRLSRLINQVMEFRQLDRNRMKLQLIPLDIVSFLDEIMGAFREVAESHHLDFQLHSDTRNISLWADPEKLDKIFYNLLSNAFKYSPDDRRIEVGVRVVAQAEIDGSTGLFPEGYVEILVKDEGVGIDEKDLPLVFDRFFASTQKQATGALSQAGSGIGLALTYEMVTLHRGTIAVQSELGKGTAFTVRLPLGKQCFQPEDFAPAGASGGAVAHQHDDMHGYLTRLLEEESLREQLKERGYGQPTAGLGRPTVLVVEDNADMRLFISAELGEHFRVLQAEDGQVGWEMAKTHMPDLVISDVMMPRMDGIQLLDHLKNDWATSHIPVVLLTAKASVAGHIEGLRKGADDYVAKPFQSVILVEKAKRLIETRRELRRRFSEQLSALPATPQPATTLPVSVDDDFLKQCAKIAEAHLSESEFGVDELARELGLSRSVLYRKMRAVSTISVNDFIVHIRLKYAAGRLCQPGKNVSDVAYEVGYNDPQYFSKCFKKLYGVSPTEYQKGKRTNNAQFSAQAADSPQFY